MGGRIAREQNLIAGDGRLLYQNRVGRVTRGIPIDGDGSGLDRSRSGRITCRIPIDGDGCRFTEVAAVEPHAEFL